MVNKTTSPKAPLLVLVGPTAIGKTALSLALAQKFQGEVISADSRLFYQGMDIGTAKPTAEEQAVVPHHLIDIRQPDKTITLGEYQDLAYTAIETVQAREHLPILVGGTGQYVQAVVEGWGIPRVPPKPRLRLALFQLGKEELYRWLQHLDPTAAANIHPNNVRRVIRALEVTLVAGHAISQLQEKSPPPYNICIIGLDTDRATLYRRIDERVDQMMDRGLLDEVQTLHTAGYGDRLPAMSALGYRQLVDYLKGKSTLEEAADRIKYETHRFVRQQYTWFRPDDPAIRWFNINEEMVTARVEAFVQEWLQGQQTG